MIGNALEKPRLKLTNRSTRIYREPNLVYYQPINSAGLFVAQRKVHYLGRYLKRYNKQWNTKHYYNEKGKGNE